MYRVCINLIFFVFNKDSEEEEADLQAEEEEEELEEEDDNIDLADYGLISPGL